MYIYIYMATLERDGGGGIAAGGRQVQDARGGLRLGASLLSAMMELLTYRHRDNNDNFSVFEAFSVFEERFFCV